MLDEVSLLADLIISLHKIPELVPTVLLPHFINWFST